MIVRRSSAVVSGTVGVVATALVLTFGAVPEATAATPVSQSTGRFLSGQIDQTDLDRVAAINGEAAVNTGGAAVIRQHSLSAGLLGHQLVNLPGGVQLPGGGVLTLGAINQYARAIRTAARAARPARSPTPGRSASATAGRRSPMPPWCSATCRPFRASTSAACPASASSP